MLKLRDILFGLDSYHKSSSLTGRFLILGIVWPPPSRSPSQKCAKSSILSPNYPPPTLTHPSKSMPYFAHFQLGGGHTVPSIRNQPIDEYSLFSSTYLLIMKFNQVDNILNNPNYFHYALKWKEIFGEIQTMNSWGKGGHFGFQRVFFCIFMFMYPNRSEGR